MPWSDPRSVPRDFGLVLPMASDRPAGLWAFLQMRPVAHRVRLRAAAPRTCPAARSRSARSACSNATGVVVTWTPESLRQDQELLAVMPGVGRDAADGALLEQ